MSDVDAELVMAWLDGELPPEQHAAVEALVERRPELLEHALALQEAGALFRAAARAELSRAETQFVDAIVAQLTTSSVTDTSAAGAGFAGAGFAGAGFAGAGVAGAGVVEGDAAALNALAARRRADSGAGVSRAGGSTSGSIGAPPTPASALKTVRLVAWGAVALVPALAAAAALWAFGTSAIPATTRALPVVALHGGGAPSAATAGPSSASPADAAATPDVTLAEEAGTVVESVEFGSAQGMVLTVDDEEATPVVWLDDSNGEAAL